MHPQIAWLYFVPGKAKPLLRPQEDRKTFARYFVQLFKPESLDFPFFILLDFWRHWVGLWWSWKYVRTLFNVLQIGSGLFNLRKKCLKTQGLKRGGGLFWCEKGGCQNKGEVFSWWHITRSELGAAAYQLGNTSSRTITEVKQCWARLVLGWATV